jgi:predicted ATPase
MSSERWRRVEALFAEALARPEAERTSFVQSACGADVELRDELLSLLEAQVVDEMPTTWLGAMADMEPARFVTGQRVAGRYLIHSLLGRGGMGEVYEARDEELAITVALKTLRHVGHADEALQQLKLEGLLARAVWHPNTCRVYDLDRHGDGDETVWFFTMERLHGVTLADRLREGRPTLERAARLVRQMAAGLGAVHRAGVVHCDFKPANVMLVERDGSEQAVVTDFGTARGAVRKAETPGADPVRIIGTPAYMAPEQVLGEEAGPAADIYALGVVLYEMTTGRLPFTGRSSNEVATRRIEEEAPSPRSVVPELDECWEAVILRCLAREPRRRFARAEEVAEGLAGRPSVAGPAPHDPLWRARHVLPAEPDPFIGRDADIAELERQLSGAARLVTLLGAGGMGKTRLATHYGWRRLGAWPGGVWFCDLTEARDANGIAAAVAGSFGVQLGVGNPLAQLGHAIAGHGRCLVILDNFEQVIGHAAETVESWLTQAQEARCIVTSRERLGVEAERVQRVEPLSLAAGIELFEVRARGLRPGLELEGSEADAAREIVRLVDGMPLAIELAAARMRVMSAAEIVAQMRKRFRLLTGGRDARHATLEGVIDGSWELLTPWERAAWTQCSVFEGGFTLQAAQGVLDLAEWPEAPPWIVDVLQSLVDKSLLRTWVPGPVPGEPLAPSRFGMYVSLQDYARLRLSGHEPTVEARHGAWYARFGTEEAIEALDRHDGTARRRRLGWEIENLTSACRRAVARGDGRVAVATYRAAWAVIESRGPFADAIELGRRVLEIPLALEDQAFALMTLGRSETRAGRTPEARAHFETALAIAERVSNTRLEGAILGDQGVLAFKQGRIENALDHLEAALARHREAGNRLGEGKALAALAALHSQQGRMEAARYEAALAIAREQGDRRSEGSILGNLGLLHQEQGRAEDARAAYDAALSIHREVGNRPNESFALGCLAGFHSQQGRMDDACASYEAAFDIFRELGDRRGQGIALGNLGRLYREQRRMEEARAHMERAVAIAREVGDRLYEGYFLSSLAGLHGEEGRLEEAREAVALGEILLREVGEGRELGICLCDRADIERRSGNLPAAMEKLGEAEALAARMAVGPDSELGRTLARLRQALGVERAE